MVKQRLDISNNNPGFPPDEVITNWATKYNLYEEFLSSLFGSLRIHDFFKPRIEPNVFRKYISVLKSIEKDDYVYSVTVIRQYENASVIQLHIDWVEAEDLPRDLHHHHHHPHNTLELFIGEQYDCQTDRAGGSTGHYTYNYIVSPPLPDDPSNIDLVFKEYSDHFKEKPTGLELVIEIE